MSRGPFSSETLSGSLERDSVLKVFGYGNNKTKFSNYVEHSIPVSNFSANDQALFALNNTLEELGIFDFGDRQTMVSMVKNIKLVRELNPLILAASLIILDKYNMKPPREAFSLSESVVKRAADNLLSRLSVFLSKRIIEKEIKDDDQFIDNIRLELFTYTLLIIRSIS